MMTGSGLVGKSAVLALALLAGAAGAADKALAPSEIVAAAPKADWVGIAPADLLVIDLAPGVGADGKPRARRVVIQLMAAPFSQGWIGNIRKLAAARFWDGLSVNRVQDNYVAQWGDANGDDKAKAKPLPPGLVGVPESEYVGTLRDDRALMTKVYDLVEVRADALYSAMKSRNAAPLRGDPYAGVTLQWRGWPIAVDSGKFWPVHCYGMVGVGRNLSPDTGSGAELYVVIGHAPRHLDRNIALIGRVIEGIENLSSLPRGTGALGFYETAAERVPILSVRLGNEVAGLPAYEYLSTESASFAAYADARANRKDAFFNVPAGGADVCNIPVPVRRVR